MSMVIDSHETFKIEFTGTGVKKSGNRRRKLVIFCPRKASSLAYLEAMLNPNISLRFSAFILAISALNAFGQSTRTCSDTPHPPPSFNPDWYYSEFFVPENFQVVSLYGGFERPAYIPAHHDYIAQFYRPGQTITNLDDYQLFNYDLIDEPLYNHEFDISNLGVVGEGILRFSVPITHGVIWNEACVTIAPVSDGNNVESVPEPATMALFVMGISILGMYGCKNRKLS